MERGQKPLVAKHTTIADVVRGTWAQRGAEVNAVLLPDGTEVARTNIIGLVVHIGDGDPTGLVVDDGTERILVRAFEQVPGLAQARLGDPVLVIGRPRAYGEDRFLVPECVRKLDSPLWLRVRRLQFGSFAQPTARQQASAESQVVEEDVVGPPPHLRILAAIRGIDTGPGADVEQVLRQTGCSQDDIERLLVRGEIFEVSPGRLKVLE